MSVIEKRGKSLWIWFWVAFGPALALYAVTAERGVSLPDSAIVMEAMATPVVSAFACNHTLNNLIGWLVIKVLPWGAVPWRCNMVSALYGAIVAGLFLTLALRLGASKFLACAGTLALALSHGLWWHATVVENYGLSAVLLLACAHLVVSIAAMAEARSSNAQASQSDGARRDMPDAQGWRVCVVFALAGMALFNHLQNGVLLVGLLWALPEVWTTPRRTGIWALAGFLAGFAPYAVVAIWEFCSGRVGGSWVDWYLGGGGFGGQMWQYSQLGAKVVGVTRLWLLNWPNLFGLAALAGVVALAGEARKTTDMAKHGWWRLARLLLVVFVVTVAFFSGYETWDRFSFFLLAYVAAAIAGMMLLIRCEQIATAAGDGGRRAFRLLLLAMMVTVLASPWLYYVQAQRLVSDGRANFLTRPYRSVARQYQGHFDMAGMLLDPVRHDKGTIERRLRNILTGLPDEAVWVDDGALHFQARWLQEHEGLREDVRLELLRAGVMPGHGAAAGALALRRQWRDAEGRWFLSATNGVAAEMVEVLRQYGWRLRPFDIAAGRPLLEIVR